MTQIDLSKLEYYSGLPPFINVSNTQLSQAISSQILTANSAYQTSTTLPITGNFISHMEAQNTGIDTRWYPFKGSVLNAYTSGNVWTGNLALAAYYIELDTGYTSSALTMRITIQNQTSGSVTVPAFTINTNISLYQAPF